MIVKDQIVADSMTARISRWYGDVRILLPTRRPIYLRKSNPESEPQVSGDVRQDHLPKASTDHTGRPKVLDQHNAKEDDENPVIPLIRTFDSEYGLSDVYHGRETCAPCEVTVSL